MNHPSQQIHQGRTRSALEQAVFGVMYRSKQQRFRRLIAIFVLLGKHGTRGLIFLWPAYVVMAVFFGFAHDSRTFIYVLALAPGMAMWFAIYLLGAQHEYRKWVRGQILGPDFVKLLLRC